MAQSKVTRRYRIAAAQFDAPLLKPGLYITGTPIGNLRDITVRALETLAGVDRILCEDTRITRRLLERYGIATPLASYHEHNAEKVRPRILASLAEDVAFALVSDAGLPLVSDPGFRLVRQAVDIGIHVEAVPGVSATLTALQLSGLPSDRFLFAGFLPSRSGERRSALADLKTVRASLVFFESPHRIIDMLAAIQEVMGDRQVAVARELTKLHEEVLRGSASAVATRLRKRASIKGEITLVVGSPVEESAARSPEDIDIALREAARTLPAGQAAADVARRFGLTRKEAHRRLMAIRDEAR